MAKVQWSAGIDSVSGALAKPGSNPQHSCEHMLLGTHRVAETTSKDCNRLYMRKKAEAHRNPSAEELATRNRFKAIAQAVAARRADLSKVTQDQVAFKAQKDLPGGKKTMKAYLWSVCAEEIG